MTNALPLMTEAEARRSVAADERAGFGVLETARGRLPLRTIDVHATIDGLLYELTVQQTFLNATDEPLEATYIFPLPDRAAVTSFRMEVGGRVIEGVLEERGQARREYDAAIQAGHRAAITEQERPDVFTLRVGNLMPGEQATTRLVLVGPLAMCDGEATFRFPLVVAPRYVPGCPLPGDSVGDGTVLDTDAVPDASRITPPVLLPGFPNPVRLGLEVELRPSGLVVREVRSSLHAVQTDGDTAGGFRIRVQPGERPDRDFILRFRVADEAIQTALTVTPDAADPTKGTFALTLVPPSVATAGHRPRDVVFVLDRSGSMHGWKIVAARRAVARMVDTLTDADRFGVYAFDNAIESPPAFGGLELVAATDRQRFRAVEFLSGIDARGGTEMAAPLKQAVDRLAAGDAARDRVLVLITDGQVGNEDQILRLLGAKLQSMRIFTLGIDRSVNAGFLRRLAVLGGGSCEFVESEDRLDEVMARIHRRLGCPVLTTVNVEPDGLNVERDSLVPARLPDLFGGAPLVILGRYHGACDGSITVAARDATGRGWSRSVPATRASSTAAARVWARARLRDLEDRYIVADHDREGLEKQLVATSIQFSVLCRFTAFVAVDRSEVVNEGGSQHRIIQPVSYPQGWEMPIAGAARLMACKSISVPYLAPEQVDAATAGPASAVQGKYELLEQVGHGARGAVYQARDTELNRIVTLKIVGGQVSVEPDVAPPPEQPRTPGAAARPVQRQQTGKLSRMVSRLLGRSDDAAASAASDLAAYRRRAAELLEQLQQSSGGDAIAKLTALGILAERLASLVEDLQSVGAPAAEINPLRHLLQMLRDGLAESQPSEAEVTRRWSDAARLLGAFAESLPAGATAADSRRQERFWK